MQQTGATGMECLGIKQQVVEALLGHTAGSKAGVTGIYQLHTYEEEKRAALEKWAVHVTALLAWFECAGMPTIAAAIFSKLSLASGRLPSGQRLAS